MRLVDGSRSVDVPGGGRQPRTLVTYIRYPAIGSGGGDLANAAPEPGRYPLVVFGHGFAVGPATYTKLLRAWARAGYVVAAPAFPLGKQDAPGSPDESDLPNQPRDMSFTITSVTRMLAGELVPGAIAVAGQSDGGDTALAAAYDRYDRDTRVRAAVILAGAEIPGVAGFDFPPGSPPLLAVQGTADTINPPSLTSTYYAAARGPKYRLDLFGAGHLPPYTDEEPQFAIVTRVTIAFLNRYLKHERTSLGGNVPGIAALGVG